MPRRVERVGQPPADAMGPALDARDAVPQREQQRAPLQIARQQPEPVVAEVEHDPVLGQLRREVRPWHDGHRASAGRLDDPADGRAQERREAALGERTVPRGEEDEGVPAARVGQEGASCRLVGVGVRTPGLDAIDERPDARRRVVRARDAVEGTGVGRRSTPSTVGARRANASPYATRPSMVTNSRPSAADSIPSPLGMCQYWMLEPVQEWPDGRRPCARSVLYRT
jgi:hypothetical protein